MNVDIFSFCCLQLLNPLRQRMTREGARHFYFHGGRGLEVPAGPNSLDGPTPSIHRDNGHYSLTFRSRSGTTRIVVSLGHDSWINLHGQKTASRAYFQSSRLSICQCASRELLESDG